MPTSSSFDVIIVGAGSAGCVFARRLSDEGNLRVALLEAGGDPDPILSRIPGAAPGRSIQDPTGAFVRCRRRAYTTASSTIPEGGSSAQTSQIRRATVAAAGIPFRSRSLTISATC